jgi:hypothetical protein
MEDAALAALRASSPFRYVKLGRIGLDMSRICIGCMS